MLVATRGPASRCREIAKRLAVDTEIVRHGAVTTVEPNGGRELIVGETYPLIETTVGWRPSSVRSVDSGLLMDFLIREATVDDWPQVAGLLVELGRDVPEHAATNPSHVIHFGGHLARREVVTLVAESGSRLLGFLDMEYRQRLGHPRPQAWVNDLVVAGSERSRGVGKTLLDHAEELARRRGCFRMSLETATWRERTHAFYEREGWLDYGKWFIKVLDPSWKPSGPPADGD